MDIIWVKLKELAIKSGKPFFTLAPMADVTDWPFRQIIADCGRPDLFYTEFVSADGLASERGRDKLLPMLYFTKDEHPIVAQIFGARPETIMIAAKMAGDLGFDGIDINMGCPDRKVLKQGAGIALCRTPNLAKEIITAARQGAGAKPVSVKTRLGYNLIDLEWIKTLLQTNIAALAVHLRTMKEASDVPAHWEVLPEIIKMRNEISPGTLIIGNGDISSYSDGIARAAQSGADGIMVGRGIFHNPWLFNPADNPENKTIHDRLGLLMKHTELFVGFWSRPPFNAKKLGRGFDVLKKFYKAYISGWDGASKLRAALMQAKNKDEVRAIVENVFSSNCSS